MSDLSTGPLVCDECGQPVQVVCLLGDASNQAVQQIMLAAHKRFHAEDRALAEAQREGTRRMGEVGPIAERIETTEEHAQCARCGSSAVWVDCSECTDGVYFCDDEDGEEYAMLCGTCDHFGGWHCCGSSAEWCQANPLPGREAVGRGAVEWYEVPVVRTVLPSTNTPEATA